MTVDVAERIEPRRVVIPYSPRDHFRWLHNTASRFVFVVAHRRAGKSVAIINHMIRAALTNTRKSPPPRYAYIGPSFAQTKDLIWGYVKQYTASIPGMSYSEGELWAEFPNGARITLYGGSAAYERMRGLYFDGVAMDEYAMLASDAWATVIRPCLADYRGWAVLSGTSNGEDHFYELKVKAEKNIARDLEVNPDAPPRWIVKVIPVNETDALHPDELAEMTADMSPGQYAREMLCSFAASVEGAYYSEQMNRMQEGGRITKVPYDPQFQVVTCWDLGIDDFMAVWFFQRVGREIRLLEYAQYRHKGLEYCIPDVKARPYDYAGHIFPHDLRARELVSGKSRQDYAQEHLGNVHIAPNHRVEDGIQATRIFLDICVADQDKCAVGLAALRSYSKGRNGKPLHDGASHPADAIRTGAMGIDQVLGWTGTSTYGLIGAIKRRVRGII